MRAAFALTTLALIALALFAAASIGVRVFRSAPHAFVPPTEIGPETAATKLFT